MATEADILYAAPQKVADRMAALAAEMIGELRPTYELVYVDYRDEMSDEDVAALMRGDWETLDQGSIEEWAWEQRSESAWSIVEELVKDLDIEEDEYNELRASGEIDGVIEAIQERDESDPIGDLARNTRYCMCRVEVVDEDNAWSFEEITLDSFFEKIPLERTPANEESARRLLAETSAEFHVRMGYWLFTVHPHDVWELGYPDEGQKVKITNPGVYLCNPFMGDGWCEPFEGEVIFDRADLRADKDACGYGWQQVVGEPLRDFETTIKLVEP